MKTDNTVNLFQFAFIRRALMFLMIAFASSLYSCGGTSIGNPVVVQTHPLSGPNAAFNRTRSSPLDFLVTAITRGILGITSAYAVVQPFNRFEICLEYIVFERMDGTFEQQNGSPNIPINPGLVVFGPSDTTAKTLGDVTLTPGSILKNVKFAIATVPTLCQGANYSALYNSSSTGGDIQITQNVAFRFDFAAPGYTITGDPQVIDLLLGQIVNGMFGLGAGLNNSTIQTINVGQAQ